MKRLLIGAAVGALMLPATATFAQQMHTFDDGHAHECLNESCTVFSLFPTADQDPAGSGWQGTEAPKFGTWGFDLAGRDLSVAPGAVGAAKALVRTLGPRIDAEVIDETIRQLADIWEGAEATAGIDAFFAKTPAPWLKPDDRTNG